MNFNYGFLTVDVPGRWASIPQIAYMELRIGYGGNLTNEKSTNRTKSERMLFPCAWEMLGTLLPPPSPDSRQGYVPLWKRDMSQCINFGWTK